MGRLKITGLICASHLAVCHEQGAESLDAICPFTHCLHGHHQQWIDSRCAARVTCSQPITCQAQARPGHHVVDRPCRPHKPFEGHTFSVRQQMLSAVQKPVYTRAGPLRPREHRPQQTKGRVQATLQEDVLQQTQSTLATPKLVLQQQQTHEVQVSKRPASPMLVPPLSERLFHMVPQPSTPRNPVTQSAVCCLILCGSSALPRHAPTQSSGDVQQKEGSSSDARCHCQASDKSARSLTEGSC